MIHVRGEANCPAPITMSILEPHPCPERKDDYPEARDRRTVPSISPGTVGKTACTFLPRKTLPRALFPNPAL